MTVSVFLGYYSSDSLVTTTLIWTCFDGALTCLVSILTGFLCLISISAAVKLLLDMGSDINAQIETNRNTALTLACFQVRTKIKTFKSKLSKVKTKLLKCSFYS